MTEDTKKRNKRQQDWQRQSRDRVNMIFSKGFKDRVQEAAAAAGLSVSKYVELAVDEKIERDNGEIMPPPITEPPPQTPRIETIAPEVWEKILQQQQDEEPEIPEDIPRTKTDIGQYLKVVCKMDFKQIQRYYKSHNITD